MHSLPTHCVPFPQSTCHIGVRLHRRAAASCLHQLPEDVLHAIMRQLRGNEAVKLATLHPALRRALGTLPSLHPSVVLDVSVIRDGACTRGEHAARQKRQRRCESFSAFRAAHPGITIEAVTVRMELPAVLPRHVDKDAVFDVHWLPLRPLRRLCVVTDALASGLAQVSKPFSVALQCACRRRVASHVESCTADADSFDVLAADTAAHVYLTAVYGVPCARGGRSGGRPPQRTGLGSEARPSDPGSAANTQPGTEAAQLGDDQQI